MKKPTLWGWAGLAVLCFPCTLLTQTLPAVLASSNAPFCEGTSNLQLMESGGNAVAWAWSGPNGFNSTVQNPVIISPAAGASGVYTVTVTNATGLTNSATLSVLILPKPLIVASDAAVCAGASVQLQASGGINCSWSPAAGLNNPVSCNPVASPVSTTTYFVTLQGGNGCSAVKPVKVTVHHPGVLVCNDLITIALDADGSVPVLPQMVLQNSLSDSGFYTVTILDNMGQSLGNTVTCAEIGKDLTVKITDNCNGSACWGKVAVEDNMAPVIACQDLVIPCAVPEYSATYLKNTLHVAGAYPGVTENCVNYTLTYTDVWHNLDCGQSINGLKNLSAYVIRHWKAVDTHGNTASCQQYIYLAHVPVADIQLPADKTLGCGSPNTAPAATGAPAIKYNGLTINLFPDVSYCELSVAYTDLHVDICDGSYKILRTWTLYDWCAPVTATIPVNPLIYTQIIKIMDLAGPQMSCPANLTVSTDPFNCCATVDLPDMILSDNCSRVNNVQAFVARQDTLNGDQLIALIPGYLSDFPDNNPWNPDTLGNFGLTSCLPVDLYTVTYQAEDDCGNTSTCSFELSVADLIPPVAACDQFTKVALSAGGTTEVYAETFDDGSYDQCCLQKFEARRANGLCLGEPDDFGPTVEFCCKDLGKAIPIIMRVTDCHGNTNDCTVQVTVEDKIKPVCVAPPNVTVNCENFDFSLGTYGVAKGTDNCCVDNITATANYNLFDTVCNIGTIVRTFRVTDCAGLSNLCTQQVQVDYVQNYFIKMPNDAVVKKCDGTGNFGKPSFFGEDCELIGVSFEDQIFTLVPDACFKIERTWKIINWCTYEPNKPCIHVPNPDPSSNPLDPNNIRGPVIAPPGSTGFWTPTTTYVSPGSDTLTNYSQFWVANANCYDYHQIIKVIDTQDPAVNAPHGPVDACDLTQNAPDLWNETYWWDSAINSHNLCEGTPDLSITAVDSCTGPNVIVHYLLFLDLNQDGIMETVINSTKLPATNTVQFGNALNPNFSGGETRRFDERNLPLNQQYRFGLKTYISGNLMHASVAWNTAANPDQYTPVELPYGTHKIKWIVEDGCGNETIREYNFTVKDCKAPTVVCTNGLSANIMPGGMVTLWASDFLKYADDNCTPANQIIYAIRRSGTGAGFPLDAQGNPLQSVTFNCSDIGTQSVELWARDLAGNADFCETYVIVQDNAGNCPNIVLKVAGALATESAEGLEEGSVELSGMSNSVTAFTYTVYSDASGHYTKNGVPLSADFTVTPAKNDNPLNGVSTYDLVLISKHILGEEPLSTPYKMIAADANRSGSITTLDIVELRKLILGIYSELPNNNSWLFVDSAFVFPNPQNPFQTAFPESRTSTNYQSISHAESFVSVKIGDVNDTAIPNSLTAPEDRNADPVLFDLENPDFEAGEQFTVCLRAQEPLTGFQFSLYFKDLDLLELLPGPGMTADQFASFPEQHTLTVSSFGVSAPAFCLKFRALLPGRLQDFLVMTSLITKAEAYPSTASGAPVVKPVALQFTENTRSFVQEQGFELYQNQPNPFINRTIIGFHLPAPSETTLFITDALGRTVYQQKGFYPKGDNRLVLERARLGGPGIYTYTLQTDFGSLTRVMMNIE